MTDDYEDWEAEEQPAWEPKTPREEREALGNAPLATLRATPAGPQAAALMRDLAERYPRPQAAKGKAYARRKTLVGYPWVHHTRQGSSKVLDQRVVR